MCGEDRSDESFRLGALGFPGPFTCSLATPSEDGAGDSWAPLRCLFFPWLSIVFLGGGHFGGARGVRQGAPVLSRYLFVLSMDHLVCLLVDQAAEDGLVGYHTWCKHIHITHLTLNHLLTKYYKY